MADLELPSQNVTFLFTDIEGSTRLIEELGEDGYIQALAAHRDLIRKAFGAHGGVEVDTQGDAFLYAFAAPSGAVAAAAQAQHALGVGRIKVRMGLHTGLVRLTDEGYAGRELHRAARIAAAGHGGQVVLSAVTRALVTTDVTELGQHRLKDFPEPVVLYQLGSDKFAPLKTISNTNLPRPASSFIGRRRERDQVVAMLRDGTRLLTLSGPGGSGKTRLAIDAASELVTALSAGVFWVGLAALREPALVPETIAQTIGARDDLAEHIGQREMLLVLDNFEQVVDAAAPLGNLLERCVNVKVLVTSRELLRIDGEVEFAVPPLVESDAVELFCARSRLAPTDTIARLCRRLDDLPLALELAAARTHVSPLTRSSIACHSGSICSKVVGTPTHANGLYVPRLPGATTCSTKKNGCSSPGWRCSGAAGRSKQRRTSPSPISTRCSRSSRRAWCGTRASVSASSRPSANSPRSASSRAERKTSFAVGTRRTSSN